MFNGPVWSHATIRELLARAECEGVSRAELPTPRDAELFRFAIYSFRNKNSIGGGLTVTLDGNVVIVEKKEKPTVTILDGASP